MIATGLDRLLEEPSRLAGRRWALLSHGAALSADLVPAHLALTAVAGPPALLLAPEHGFYGVEQDMVPAAGGHDPWTGAPVESLYGDTIDTLKPRPGALDGLDLLVVDLQDAGARYYTYAATAFWAAEAALAAGSEVWVLDRPNPLGGEVVEGNLVAAGFQSFVGAFRLPARHGLTLGELFLLEGRRRGLPDGVTVWKLSGWRRDMLWSDVGRPWIAPSPNLPTDVTALLYPGACLVEGTELSEGRGTTRPFHWIGAPGIDPPALARAVNELELPGVRSVPLYFKPGYQKHRGEVCGGVELVVTDPRRLASYRLGVELLAVVARAFPHAFGWRREAYEFVTERPAIDLLTGGEDFRRAVESGRGLDLWIASWAAQEAAFLEERREILLYPEVSTAAGGGG